MNMRFYITHLLILTLLFMASCTSTNDDARNRFVGRYEVKEQSLVSFSIREDYEVRIYKDAGRDDGVVVSNFYNMDIDALARVDGNMLMVFPQVHGFFEIEGEGVLSGNIIRLNYSIDAMGSEQTFSDRLQAEFILID